MDTPPDAPRHPLEVVAHAGARQDLGDAAFRVEAGVAGRVGWLGLEVQGCGRVPAENRYEGQYAALLLTDVPPSRAVFRDDLGTLGALVTVVPGPLAAVGPDLAIGPELGWTAYRVIDLVGEGDQRMEPFPTLGLFIRGGVHGRVGRVGLRFTMGYRANWLRSVDIDLNEGPVAAVGEWRTAIDATWRVR